MANNKVVLGDHQIHMMVVRDRQFGQSAVNIATQNHPNTSVTHALRCARKLQSMSHALQQ